MPASLASLFLAHRGELLAFLARRLRDRQLAGDMVQEVYLRLADRGEAQDYANGRAYLFRVASNLAVDHERRQARRATVYSSEPGAKEVADDKPGAEQLIDGRDRLALVRQALNELPELTREIIRLVRIEGHSYPETARILGISESSVQKHLASGVRHAAGALAKADGDTITGFRGPNVIPFETKERARRT